MVLELPELPHATDFQMLCLFQYDRVSGAEAEGVAREHILESTVHINYPIQKR